MNFIDFLFHLQLPFAKLSIRATLLLQLIDTRSRCLLSDKPEVPFADGPVELVNSGEYEPVLIGVAVVRDLRVIQEHVGRLAAKVGKGLCLYRGLLLLIFLPCLPAVVNDRG